MTLADLDPQFFKIEQRIETRRHVVGDPLLWKPGDQTEERTGPQTYFVNVETLAEADGVRMLCPKCFQDNGGPVGTHGVHVYFSGRNVPPELNNGVTWEIKDGTGYADLTVSPSILLIGGCEWHGFITNGQIVTC